MLSAVSSSMDVTNFPANFQNCTAFLFLGRPVSRLTVVFGDIIIILFTTLGILMIFLIYMIVVVQNASISLLHTPHCSRAVPLADVAAGRGCGHDKPPLCFSRGVPPVPCLRSFPGAFHIKS